MTQVPTLQEAFDEYIRVKPLRAVTINGYKKDFKKLESWHNRPLNEITSAEVLERHQNITEAGAPVVANSVVKLLRQLYNFSNAYFLDEQDEPTVRKNPAKKMLAVRQLNARNTRIFDFIHDYEIVDWWRAVRNLRSTSSRDFLTFVLLTGLRLSATASLRFDQIDFVAGTILLTDEQMKNGKGQELPVSDYVLAMVKDRAEFSNSRFLFPSRGDLNSGRDNVSGAVKRVVEESGVVFTCHTLRRTHCRILAHPECMADELAIKGLMTHSDASVTWQYYLRLHPERLRPAVQSVTDFVLRRVRAKRIREAGLVDLGGSSVWLSVQ